MIQLYLHQKIILIILKKNVNYSFISIFTFAFTYLIYSNLSDDDKTNDDFAYDFLKNVDLSARSKKENREQSWIEKAVWKGIFGILMQDYFSPMIGI